MVLIPFPFFLAEIIIFFSVVNWLGFGEALLVYFLPCLLGIFIVSIWGRVAVMSLQKSLAQGNIPPNKIIHAGAIFLSGICFIVPSFFARILGVCLLLPGLRHLLIWKFKAQLLRKMSSGSAGFQFNSFGFGQGPFSRQSPFSDEPIEREVNDTGVRADILDVKPLEVLHTDVTKIPENK